MVFSILVVCLNAGDALRKTVDSILSQTYQQYEIVVKDGGSKDGSWEKLPVDPRICIINQKDTGIYDAMNQAAEYITGDYAIYMNCGDLFQNEFVLERIAQHIQQNEVINDRRTIYYGDCYVANRGYTLKFPDIFDDYFCFTKVLCHQSTIYEAALLKGRKFTPGYKMAADYEYYVHAYQNGCRMIHIPETIACYEGNGASETPKNRRVIQHERRLALKTHFSPKAYRKLWWKAQLRGMGIKQALVRINWFYTLYGKLAKVYYDRKNKNK